MINGEAAAGWAKIAGDRTRSFQTERRQRLWNVDFSSALENRTGKYFIGRDLIADQRDWIDRVYYWRYGTAARPGELANKILKFGLKIETHATASLGRTPLLLRRSGKPTLHLDPFSVAFSKLAPTDIVLCHDLGPISHPDLFQPWVGALYRRLYRRIAQAGPGLVFVSAASRNEYRRLFGDAQPMKVIYPALRTDIGDADARPIAGLGKRFLLTVGSLGNRKNQAMMLQGFGMSGLAAKGVQYVLCGAQEPGAEAIRQLAGQIPAVRLLPYVSDAELAWLYARASGFVLVSRLEGFGLPVAEAISKGLVPLVTRNSVLEEVSGRGALSASSSDPLEIAAAMNALITMTDSERAKRQDCLRTSIGRFSPEAFASAWRETLGCG